jgi:hypothetical protein
MLVESFRRQFEARLLEPSASASQRAVVPAETKFVEMALNIIDPDGAWDPEETLEFGDAARAHLDEFPITEWEIKGAFALVAQFVHDWVRDSTHGADRTAVENPARVASPLTSQDLSRSTTTSAEDSKDPSFEGLAALETEDPLSGAKLRMLLGEFEGVPTLALFVGEDEEPILIDRSALHIAIEQWWDSRSDGDRPLFTFEASADRELEVIGLDIDVEPTFE